MLDSMPSLVVTFSLYAGVPWTSSLPRYSTLLPLLLSELDRLQPAELHALRGDVLRLLLQRLHEGLARHLGVPRRAAVLAALGGDHRGQASPLRLAAALPEIVPERLRRGVAAAVVADLVDVDVGEQLHDLLLLQRVLPILDLGVAGEEQLLPADFEEEDHAGVVHGVVHDQHQLQERLGARAAQAADEPAARARLLLRRKNLRVRKERLPPARHRPDGVRRLHLPELLPQHPELRGVDAALLLHRFVL